MFRRFVALLIVTSAASLNAQLTDVARKRFDDRFAAAVGPEAFPSLAVGAIRGEDVVYENAFGVADEKSGRPARLDTMYKVGSVGKLFTATLLMMMRDNGALRLDDPVEQSLPAGVHLQHDPRGAAAITFRHLATHSSGLPEWPTNDPKLYDAKKPALVVEQYRAFTEDPLEFPIGGHFRYSGLGYSILGHALERIGGASYEELLRRMLFVPLGMRDTVITLSAEQRRRVPNHYAWDGKEVPRDPADPGPRWEFPTSAHYSTVADMMKFLRLQLRDGEANVKPVRGGTLTEMHTSQRLQNNWNDAIGIGWWIEPNSDIGDIVWHKGGSRGFGSYVAFSRRYNLGVVLFTNRNKSVEEIGRWFLLQLARELGAPHTPTLAEAEAFNNWRDWSDAAWAWESVVKQHPDDAESWYRLGSAHQRMGNCPKAIDAFERSISAGGKNEYAYFLLARCHMLMGDRERAIDGLRRAAAAGFRDEDNELATDPVFDPLRNDPRFVEVMAAVGQKSPPR